MNFERAIGMRRHLVQVVGARNRSALEGERRLQQLFDRLMRQERCHIVAFHSEIAARHLQVVNRLLVPALCNLLGVHNGSIPF